MSSYSYHERGGGVLIIEASPSLRHVVVRAARAYAAGGMYFYKSGSVLEHGDVAAQQQ